MRANAAELGFTLIEAMVALAIVALGMMAVNTQLNRYAMSARYIEQKALASWIASNRLTELSISGQWPDLGRSDDELEFAGQQWLTQLEIAETPVPNLRRADISVALATAPEAIIHRVSTLLEPPPPGGFAPVQWNVPNESPTG
jgi:general secretion pathway protein I